MRQSRLVIGFALFGIATGTSSAQVPITQGQPDTHTGVVYVESYKPGNILGRCSGIHLGLGLILTAAHCLEGIESTHSIYVYFTTDPRRAFQATEYLTFQQWSNDPTRNFDNDLGAIFINHCSIPNGSQPIPTLNSSTSGPLLEESDIGTIVSIVGFAGSNTDNLPESLLRKVGRAQISNLYTSMVVTEPFVGPLPDGSAESMTEHGDSGGPLLISRDGIEYVAAVNTGTCTDSSMCGMTSYYTRIDTGMNAQFVEEVSSVALIKLTDKCQGEPGPCNGCNTRGNTTPGALSIFLIIASFLWTLRRRFSYS